MISKMYSPIRAFKKSHFETVCRVCFLPPPPTIEFPIPGDLVPGHRCRGNVSFEDCPDGCHNNGALATARVRLLDVHSAGALTEGNRDKTIGGDFRARQQRVGPAYSAHQVNSSQLRPVYFATPSRVTSRRSKEFQPMMILKALSSTVRFMSRFRNESASKPNLNSTICV
jgi:hypothetical protein